MNWLKFQELIEVNSTAIYVVLVLLLGALTLMRFLRLLRISKHRRKRWLRARERLDAVATESPIENPTAVAQDRGMENITRNATVMHRLVVPLIAFLTALFAMVPLLSRVPATLISFVIAIVTVVLGVAARPLIENAMSGLVISFSRLVNIGDTVRMDDKYGTVEDISITHTTIKLWDWRRYVVPNSSMLQQSFVNYSVHDKYEWTYVSFNISYEADYELAKEIALEIPRASKYFASHEDPQFWVMGMGEQSYEIWLAAWANTPSDAWYLRTDMREGLIIAFAKHGIPVQRMRHEMVVPNRVAG